MNRGTSEVTAREFRCAAINPTSAIAPKKRHSLVNAPSLPPAPKNEKRMIPATSRATSSFQLNEANFSFHFGQVASSPSIPLRISAAGSKPVFS